MSFTIITCCLIPRVPIKKLEKIDITTLINLSMTVSKLYYGPNISIVENITRDSKNIIYDKNYGLCQYSNSKGYLKNNIFTWKFPKNCYEIIEKEDYNIKLKCRTLTGKLLIFDISSVSTVYDIKEKIFQEFGTPHDQQRLIFRGIQIEDKKL